MSKVFNTAFEVSLRILLLLSAEDKARTADMLAAMDFISVYGRSFGIAETNLHGDNIYKYGEFANRRALVKDALKSLVRDGMVDVYEKDGGFHFAINDSGDAFVLSLHSDYAREYEKMAESTAAMVKEKTERELIAEINRQSTADLQQGGHYGQILH